MTTPLVHHLDAAPRDSLALLIDSIRDYAIIMLDPDGRVASWNAGAEQLVAYTAPEILGRHFSIFYPPEDTDSGKWERELTIARTTGRFEEENWRVRKDGSRFWADVSLSAMRDDVGGLVGFAKVTRDLTERRITEESLRRSEERFRLLVEGVKDTAIFVLDPDGRVATWNSGAARIKGYTADEIIGQHFSKFYPTDEAPAERTAQELATAVREGRFEEEAWRVRKDGSRFWASVSITPLRDPAGHLLGFAKVTRDLSERRKLEEERLKVGQAEEALRLRDEFLSIASHELRTPLSSLLLQLESLRAHLEAASPKLVERVDRASRAGGRLTLLLDTLLDVSRIATGRVELQPTSFDLEDAVREVVERMTEAAIKAGNAVTVTPAPAPVIGSWDRLRVEQVIINLLANAFKYASATPVEIAIGRDGDDGVLTVRDHGPGIKEGELARVFERFERGVSMRHFGGMGLGLYLVDQIAGAHGGTARAANAPGGGAIVTVRLPLTSPRVAQEQP